MSPSKLESLPNEILIELFEKHINGIDIIKAFRFQLNKRIDSIILECRRFKFDFIKCYKTDFCFSMGLLPAYADKVEQLALSEQNSPGQIHAFLASKYLSPFTSFTGLRKLYMNIIIDTVEPTILRQAFESLTKTDLHTLSIVINGTDSSRFFDSIIPKLFRMQTLKQLSIISNSTMERIDWQTIADYSSNIEYLTLKGVNCDFENTRHIFQCASGLKYVDLTLEANRYRRYNTTKQPNAQQVIQMSKLQTMIVKINGDTTSLRDSINSMFQLVPFLRRLEVRIDNSSFDVTIWENLVKNNLTKLSHFILQYNSFYLKEGDVKNILGIIQIPFWMERNDFHIILKKHTEESENSSDQYYLGSLENSSADDFRKFAEKWYVLPERQEKNSRFHPANQITNVTISRSLARNYDLNNVENLIIDQMDDNVLDLMQKHISFSTVKHLDISAVRNITKYISNILPSMINLRSLRLTTNELNILKALPLTNLQKLTFIDLTMDKYPFSKDHANTLSTAFPNVEHLRVAPLNLSDVPILNTYFPKLHSLTFMPMGNQLDDDYKKQKFDFDLRRIMPFLFHRKAQWLTIWLDQDVYTGDIWQKSESGRIFNLNIKQPRYNPYSYYNNDDDDY